MTVAAGHTGPAARLRWWLLLAALLAVHLVVLYAPRAGGPGQFPGIDKVVHAATFGSVAWAGLRAGIPARWWVPLVSAHAVVSELVQYSLLPHRSGDPLDVLADLVGVALGVLTATGLRRASWRGDRSGPRGDAGRAPAGGDARAG